MNASVNASSASLFSALTAAFKCQNPRNPPSTLIAGACVLMTEWRPLALRSAKNAQIFISKLAVSVSETGDVVTSDTGESWEDPCASSGCWEEDAAVVTLGVNGVCDRSPQLFRRVPMARVPRYIEGCGTAGSFAHFN